MVTIQTSIWAIVLTKGQTGKNKLKECILRFRIENYVCSIVSIRDILRKFNYNCCCKANDLLDEIGLLRI